MSNKEHPIRSIIDDTWKVGDLTLPYKTSRPATKIVAFEGASVVLEDGTTMHRSYLKRPGSAVNPR